MSRRGYGNSDRRLTFDNGRTVKFYRYSLQEVVEKEGRAFTPYYEP